MDIGPCLERGGERKRHNENETHSFIRSDTGRFFVHFIVIIEWILSEERQKGRLFLIENEASEKTQLYNQDFR